MSRTAMFASARDAEPADLLRGYRCAPPFVVGIDEDRDTAHDEQVTAPGAPVRTFVVAAREDLETARDTRTALEAP